MKSEILKFLMLVSKGACYLFLLQLVSLQLLMAGDISGQSLKEMKINLHMTNATPLEVFKEIEKKTDLTFVHNRSVAKVDHPLQLDFENATIEAILKYVGKESGLEFIRINRNVSVSVSTNKKEAQKKVLEAEKELSGSVKDSQTGEPLVGATVKVKGTQIGTATDAEGKFRLKVPDDAESLEISFLGYLVKEIPIGSSTSFNVSLDVNAQQLGVFEVKGIRESLNRALEVKKAAINSVDLIVAEDIAKFPQSNVSEALQRVTGVQIRRDYEGGVGNEVTKGNVAITTGDGRER